MYITTVDYFASKPSGLIAERAFGKKSHRSNLTAWSSL